MSTCEAEFNVLSVCVRDTKWVRQVLEALNISDPNPSVVYQDNLGTINWTEEVQGLRKVKHVGLKYHYVK